MSKERQIIIAICLTIVIATLVYAILILNQNWQIMIVTIILSLFTSIIVSLMFRTENDDFQLDYNVETFKTLIPGGPGSGHGYSVANGKECIYVPLTKMDPTKPEVSLVVDDNTEPIIYGEYSIFCIRGMIFMYAVRIDGALYCFDIRDIACKVKFTDPQNEINTIIGDKRRWLQSFFKSLEDSQFIFDIEKNYK